MLKMASFLTELPEWTQPPKPPQDGTDLIYYKSIVICLFGLFQETTYDPLMPSFTTVNSEHCVPCIEILPADRPSSPARS